MSPSDYSLATLWRSTSTQLAVQRPSFFLTATGVPLLFWALGAALNKPRATSILLSSIPILAVFLLGVWCCFALPHWRDAPVRTPSPTRRIILGSQAYYTLTILELSAYCLWVAIGVANHQSALPQGVAYALVGIYAVSAVVGIAWSPSSLPRSRSDDEVALRRERKWLPTIISLQVAIISAGVFAGAWVAHDKSALGSLFVIGVSSLGALMLVIIGILGAYRWIVLAAGPIPPEVLGEQLGKG